MVRFTWKMRNVLYRLKKRFSNFWDFYFLSYGRFCSQFLGVYTLITDQKCQQEKCCLKRCTMLWNEFMIFFVQFLVSETTIIIIIFLVHFVSNIRSEVGT